MNTVKINSENTKMVAHRGVSGIEKENTCPAFVAAGNRSYFGIETDIHITKDKKFVVIHDSSTKRVSFEKYDINVEDVEYSDLKDIVLPDRDGSYIRQDIRIPLLAEYVKICKKYDKICVLELKGNFETEDCERLIKEINELEYLGNVIFISFSEENCINMRALLPEAEIQFLKSGEIKEEELVSFLLENSLDLDIDHRSLTKDFVDRLHSHGIKVNCWTCDNKERAEELVLMGVDFITSNILE
ncbi:MAG: hypothetical protein E7587_00800 [Ruminococcaceae bacterium]|nr:hypothetical protein [Oscillospiraceae bacterium]